MKMIEDRVTEAMAGVHAQQRSVLLELQHIQHGLLILAGAVDVSPGDVNQNKQTKQGKTKQTTTSATQKYKIKRIKHTT
jgi:hypothetical protein